jgi:holo-[acyl-carrier protein] synthase
MIIGIGTDIIEIARVGRLIDRDPFPDKMFSPAEVVACEAEGLVGKRRASRFAGLFAAKEAVMKALGTGWAKGVAFTEIVVEHSEEGQPRIRLEGKTLEIARSRGVGEVHVSISHSDDYAVAFAVLEG